MFRFRKFLSFSLFFALLIGCALAQGGFRVKGRSVSELQAEQRRTVGAWCRLDFDGSRLAPETWTRFAPYTSMAQNPDFRKINVISRYDVQAPEQYSTAATVTYYVLGEYEPGIGYTAVPDRRDVTFRFVNKDDRLFIVDIDSSSPFVSRAALLKFLQGKLAAAHTDAERGEFQRAVDSLTQSQPATTK